MASNAHHHHLLARLCQLQIQELVHEAVDKPFYVISNLLYQIVQRIMTEETHFAKLKSFHPRSLDDWNQHFIDWFISDIYEVLKLIYKDMEACDLSALDFIPTNVEREINAVKKFVDTIYHKHIPFQYDSDVYFSIIDNQCQDILDIVTVKRRFKRSPLVDNLECSFWSKLLRLDPNTNFLEGSVHPVCLSCQVDFVQDSNFAIVDCCRHVFCITCAQKQFDVPPFMESRCPMCQKNVSAWTTKILFKLFNSTTAIKKLSYGEVELHMQQGEDGSFSFNQKPVECVTS